MKKSGNNKESKNISVMSQWRKKYYCFFFFFTATNPVCSWSNLLNVNGTILTVQFIQETTVANTVKLD